MKKMGTLRLLAELFPLALIGGAFFVTSFLASRVRVEPGRATVADVPVAKVQPPIYPVAEPPDPPSLAAAAEPWTPQISLEEAALLDALATGERTRAEQARSRIAAMSDSLRKTLAEQQRWRNRVMLVRTQVERLQSTATRAESDAEALQAELENLQLKRDLTKRGLEHARERAEDSYAVVPFQGPNGTWRQPIVLDCREGAVILLPDAQEFSISELDGLMSKRSHPLIAQVRRRVLEIENRPGREGIPRVAYVLFLVRPEGVRSFYEARALLESLGIAFGYELIDSNWDVQVPIEPQSAPNRGMASAREKPTGTPVPGEGNSGTGNSGDPHDEELHVWQAPAGSRDLRDEARDENQGFGDSSVAFDGPVGSSRGSLDATSDGGEVSLDPPTGRVSDPRRGAASAHDDLELDGYTRIRPGMADDHGTDRQGASGSAFDRAPRDRNAHTTRPGDGRAGLPNRPESVSQALRQSPASASSPTRPSGLVSNPSQSGTSSASGTGGSQGAGTGPGQPSSPVVIDHLRNLGSPSLSPSAGQRLDISVICRAQDLLIQPGGYRITTAKLESTTLLVERIRAIAANAQRASRGQTVVPHLRFVVEPRGETTFWAARRMTTYAGIDWPTTLSVAEGSGRQFAFDSLEALP